MNDFQSLIKEAFIDPIRSVLIVDDQYPTWSEILNEQLPEDSRDPELNSRSQKKNWRNEPSGTLKIINQFRIKKPALIIDIHDASDPYDPDGLAVVEIGENRGNAKLTANHLHQSDLLILDYNLEGISSGLEGRLARGILKSVLCNKHFNLVVIHTQEHDLKEVFYSCLISLSVPLHPSFEDSAKDLVDRVRGRLDELLDEEEFNPKDLPDYLNLDTYLKLRHPSIKYLDELRRYMVGDGLLYRLHGWAEKLGLKGAEKSGFAYWAIENFEKAQRDNFSDSHFKGLSWSQHDERLWLRTGRGFVTIVKKDHQDLLGELELSLQAWQPTPSRLLSAKVRHEVSCNGVEAEDRTLSKSHVFAYFYDLIRKGKTEENRAVLTREHLNRQTEALTSQIGPTVVKFGERIFEADSKTGDNFSSHYGVDLSSNEVRRLAASHFNSYVSTLPMTSFEGHLDCGHIFKIESEWWICATPACDMEPGQNTIAFIGNSKELRPFTALMLSEVKEAEITEKHINSGIYCFAETKPGEIICLGLPSQDAGGGGVVASEKVTWRIFIAKNDGRFSDSNLHLIRPRLSGEGFDAPLVTATVLAKLRYEYALNYIQKVGVSVTRIGLGYRAEAFGNVNRAVM